MKLRMSFFKEKREPVARKPLPPPIAEEITGTFLVSRFSLEEGKGGEQEASGRSTQELVGKIRAALETSEPDIRGKRILNVTITFANHENPSTRTLVGSEEKIDVSVKPEGLKGREISEIFQFLERILGKDAA